MGFDHFLFSHVRWLNFALFLKKLKKEQNMEEKKQKEQNVEIGENPRNVMVSIVLKTIMTLVIVGGLLYLIGM